MTRWGVRNEITLRWIVADGVVPRWAGRKRIALGWKVAVGESTRWGDRKGIALGCRMTSSVLNSTVPIWMRVFSVKCHEILNVFLSGDAWLENR